MRRSSHNRSMLRPITVFDSSELFHRLPRSIHNAGATAHRSFLAVLHIRNPVANQPSTRAQQSVGPPQRGAPPSASSTTSYGPILTSRPGGSRSRGSTPNSPASDKAVMRAVHFGLGCAKELDRRAGRGVNQHSAHRRATIRKAVQRRPGGRVIFTGTAAPCSKLSASGSTTESVAATLTIRSSHQIVYRPGPFADLGSSTPSPTARPSQRLRIRPPAEALARLGRPTRGEMVSEVHPCCADGDPQLARARWRRGSGRCRNLQDRWVAMFAMTTARIMPSLSGLTGSHPRTPSVIARVIRRFGALPLRLCTSTGSA